MDEYTVVFIPNCHLAEEDSCDFKEWRNVMADSSGNACKELSKSALIVSVKKN